MTTTDEPIYQVESLIAGDIDALSRRAPAQDDAALHPCGSVDDGKSTLIGRMLRLAHDLRGPPAGAGVRLKRVGTRGEAIDFALLVDGLAAEREQGITIDVAYRFFGTEAQVHRRRHPGHERYTRNMVTGASTAELAVILIDARKGVLTQTRRHSFLAHLIGIRRRACRQQDGPRRLQQGTASRRSSPPIATADSIGIADFTAISDLGLPGRQHHHPFAEPP